MTALTPYTARIRELAPSYDPRHVEAFIRIEYGTLDHLSERQFRREVKIACECVRIDPNNAELLARSFGL